ncbi:MAG: Tat pathway signal protein [Sphingomonas sp.]|nr:Tat pathway signal protein [Sphingomonas sp.]
MNRLTPALTSASTPGTTQFPPLIDDIEHRTFRYFWVSSDPETGLAPDRWPSNPFCSIAAVGFALNAYVIGVERGWVSRAEARARVLNTARFFHDAPQGPEPTGNAGYKGFFYHFLDNATGTRFGKTELSSIDTTLLMGGMLFAAQYFDGDHPEEAEIRQLVQAIYARIEWPWLQVRAPKIAMGWHPESGFIASDWKGYDEAMLLYILALGAPVHAVGPEAWQGWTSTYPQVWHGSGDMRMLTYPPLFIHQYSHCWIDFRGIRDTVMRREGFDYFENSRRATYFQRGYGAANPMRWKGYSSDIWGLTACDGPGDATHEYAGEQRKFRSYSARGPETLKYGFDDGTIAPTAALGSIAFAPEIVIPAAKALAEFQGGRVYGKYGFYDAFNPSFVWPELKGTRGSVDRELGWLDDDMLGIDQGPIITMIANARDDLIWRYMRRCEPIRRGLERAGFTGGWLAR